MEKRKVILGLKHPGEFSLEERRMIISEWLESGKTKREIWHKYTGRIEEKGHLLRWMRSLGMDIPKKWSKLGSLNSDIMSNPKKDSSLEVLQMQAKIKELEKALVNSELRATALDTMIEIAERDLKINIRKKSNTKQSTK
jgi:hypothetical protein